MKEDIHNKKVHKKKHSSLAKRITRIISLMMVGIFAVLIASTVFFQNQPFHRLLTVIYSL